MWPSPGCLKAYMVYFCELEHSIISAFVRLALLKTYLALLNLIKFNFMGWKQKVGLGSTIPISQAPLM